MARTHGRTLSRLALLLTAVAALATGCGGDADPAPAAASPSAATPAAGRTLTVYSRDQPIAEPLFTQFTKETGITVVPQWGEPIGLADRILKEGADTKADVYYGPLSDALGALSAAGRLAPLSQRQLGLVPAAYRSPDGAWVATSGRAHAVFYNTDELTEKDLPDSILGFADPAWRGRIAWDPTSRSLLDVVTEISELRGEAAARRWLQGIKANAPTVLKGGVPIVQAVAAGTQAQVGFGSHSYLYLQQRTGAAKNVGAHYYTGGAVGGPLNVAGVGIVKGTAKTAEANALVDFLLSREGQQMAASGALEIPVVSGMPAARGIPTAEALEVPGLDVRQFERLQLARRLVAEIGATK